MRAEGSVEIAAPRDATWDALTDPRVVAACVPGAGSVGLDVVGPGELALRGRIGSGFFSLPAEGRVELSALERPGRAAATLTGSAAGNSLEARAEMSLEELGAARTRVRWTADATVVGSLAGMAGPYLEREGPGIVERTLACLRDRLESAQPPSATVGDEPAPAAPAVWPDRARGSAEP